MSGSSPPPDPSDTIPDWSREAKGRFEWAPSRALLGAIRSYQRHGLGRGPLHAVARRVAVLRHRFWSVVTAADIPLTAKIGGGLILPHPNGIVIHPDAEVGPNCMFFHQVTLGYGDGGVPQVGGGVDIGAGAKLLGPITIGNRAIVGANAVVIRDVPARATVAGIPAKVIAQR